MKKLIYLIIVALILGLVLTGCSLLSNVGQVPATSQTKVKPEGLGGAKTYDWFLSGNVMPSPPYGLSDIPGSDTASKLIVNQPNGAVEVTITGVMNGLLPKTTYNVRLENEYEPFLGWNVNGSYVIDVTLGTKVYFEDLILVQVGEDITGESIELVGGGSLWTIDGGSVVGNEINFHLSFSLSSLTANFTGIIAADGSMSGTWADELPGTRSGTWATTSGKASHTGDIWSQGAFRNQQWFQFTTDAYGSGSWHVNLRDSDFGDTTGEHILSVWINKPGATILISDNFKVVVD